MEGVEVVIVGAGPAGLECAKHLAKAGKDVLVLERSTIVGKKVCAGGLTSKDFVFSVPKTNVKKFRKIFFVFPHRKVAVKRKIPIITTLSRIELGKYMYEEAKRAGAKIELGVTVTSIGKDFVLAGKRKIKYKYLVGADGAFSMVREHVELKTKKKLLAIQYRFPNIFKNLEVHVDPSLFYAGYAWIFPHKDCTLIGVGSDERDLDAKTLRKNLEVWIRKNNIDTSKGKFEGSVINYDYRGHKFDNIFLIGGAGGFTIGLTGEGIYAGRLSGKEIAHLIIDSNYTCKELKKFLRMKKRNLFLMNIFRHSGKYFIKGEARLLSWILGNQVLNKILLKIYGY